MKDVVFVTTKESFPGFELSGVRHLLAEPAQVAEVLQAVFGDPEVGVLALEETLADSLGEQPLRELSRHWRGVLVTLPAPAPAVATKVDALQRMVQRALGYHVRLEQ